MITQLLRLDKYEFQNKSKKCVKKFKNGKPKSRTQCRSLLVSVLRFWKKFFPTKFLYTYNPKQAGRKLEHCPLLHGQDTGTCQSPRAALGG